MNPVYPKQSNDSEKFGFIRIDRIYPAWPDSFGLKVRIEWIGRIHRIECAFDRIHSN